MTPKELKDFANELAGQCKCPAPEVGSKILEHIDASHLFPNAKNGVNTLVAWQQSDKPDRVYLGFAKDKDSLPEYANVHYAAERFYNDPYGIMTIYLNLTYEAVQDTERILNRL